MPNLEIGMAGTIRGWAGAIIAALAITNAGCGPPNAANIELRKQNQTLQTQVDQLTAQHQRDVDALAACERSHPTTRLLAADQLDQLFTTHSIVLGKLTGGDNPNSTQGSDTELKVYLCPVDGDGTPIKAAGSFKVEAFDLDDPAKPLIGTWNFPLAQTKTLFYSQLGMYTYVLRCPWQISPRHADLTLHVTFDDALTGRIFVEQTQAKVRPLVQ